MPLDKQIAAAQRHLHRFARRQPALPHPRHHRRARACAASQRFAHAAFKHAQRDVRGVKHLHKAHVHALGELRMLLQRRADFGNGRGFRVVHAQHGVRVAHAH